VDAKLDRRRYRRVRWFFLKALFHGLWWDIFFNRLILKWFRPPALDRWRLIARRFRGLALEMGGVLIKLGQFISIRVDILPPEVTQELAGLQDEVPAEKSEDIIAQVEDDFGRPIAEIFEWFSPVPLGAASLAQAHRVRLFSGQNAVAKVLRPGIERVVETDLAAIELAFQWLKWYKPLSRRVDFDWLADEFSLITRRELNFENEGRNAERLAENFAGDEGIYIPKIFWDYTGAHTLTLEDVSYIRIGDKESMDAAGISKPRVAEHLYNLYMRQVFEIFFVHVDPHPGNLFVRPLPCSDESETDLEPGCTAPHQPDRPFQIVFIDFGMMVEIPDRLRSALREYVIGLGTRDAHRIVQSYVKAGALLPGADLNRLEEAHQALFEHFWGVSVSKLRNTALKEAEYFFREYRDVIREAPFQFQADMLFVVRAVGILSGMAANLDPNFDVWTRTLPFAKRYAAEALQKDWPERIENLADLARMLLTLPEQIHNTLTDARRSRLTVQTSWTPQTLKKIDKLSISVDRLSKLILTAGLVIAAAIFHGTDPSGSIWKIFMALAAAIFLTTLHKK
jgi:predicted unusual protein kinase regulating ubiquinone biosynthesis (AarF/ABC1/UbiB family)